MVDMGDVEELDTAIIPPKGKVIDATAKFLRKRGEWCLHNGTVSFCEEQRTIECCKCGAILDPFDWIVRLARHEERYFDGLRRARNEWDSLIKSNKELARRERNAKLRVERWERKAELAKNEVRDGTDIQ